MSREDYEGMKEARQEEKARKAKDFEDRILPFLKVQCHEDKLYLIKKTPFCWRISNGKDYFDIWQTRAMTYINEVTEIRGFGYEEKGLKKQIELLVKYRNEKNNGKN